LVEGIARVVAVADGQAWLEPEQTASCGTCAASGHCVGQEHDGIGSISRRLEARRFAVSSRLAGHELQLGERVVIGVGQRSLVKAAFLAYGLPLLFAITVAAWLQGEYGDDLTTLLGMSGGLALGLGVARLGARWLLGRGELTPRLLRLARPGETCAND
jgi:sigma-E factor negative regulatory protein RseC